MDTRAFDGDDAGLLQVLDCRVNVVAGAISQRVIHALALTAAHSPNNLQDHQILCALH